MSENKYAEIDSPEKALDYAIRDCECKEKSIECGYKIADSEPYWNYLSNDAWEEFLKSMSPLHRAQYNDADGGELKEKKGRWGICPPKMASFGSSSRFLYNLSKDIEGFQFEKLMPTRVGGSANLDGYIMRGDVDVFIEAKCREIYSSHKTIEVSNVYKEIFEKLKAKYSKLSFNWSAKDDDDKHFKCTFNFNDKEIVHFDIKQLICHFLAISANIIENENVNTDIKFVYLIFNPQKDTCFDNKKVSAYQERILKIYKDINNENEIRKFDMEQLFYSIFKIQAERLGSKGKKYPSFKFYLADQEDYKEKIQ